MLYFYKGHKAYITHKFNKLKDLPPKKEKNTEISNIFDGEFRYDSQNEKISDKTASNDDDNHEADFKYWFKKAYEYEPKHTLMSSKPS